MTTLRRFVSALALAFFACALSAHAQAPSIEVTTGDDAAQFSTLGPAQSLHVQVFSPAGELVFEAEAASGQPFHWPMTDQKGERVPDGVYRAHITFIGPSSKLSTRVEHVTVGSQAQGAVGVVGAAPQEALAPTGSGTAGRVAKWTSSTNLGNSVITEGTGGKVGVNVAPAATLHVNGLQPAPLANNGVNAPPLLQTTGGKGGNTTASGKVGGRGASITLTAGPGGSAVSGATNGGGGSITLQPGKAGTGGTGGVAGNVLIAPSGFGNVAIGTSNPFGNKVHVVGFSPDWAAVYGESAGGVGLSGFSKGSTGAGVAGSSEGGYGVAGESASGTGVFGFSSTGFAGRFEGKVSVDGNLGIGTVTPVRPLEIKSGQMRFSSPFGDVEFTEVADHLAWVTTSSPSATLPAFRVFTGAGGTQIFTVLNDGRVGVGTSAPKYKLHVEGSGPQVGARSIGGTGVAGVGVSSSNVTYSRSVLLPTGVLGYSDTGYGVLGRTDTGYAGYFEGKAKVTNTLEVLNCTGCTVAPSDRALKANLSSIDPRSVLDKLAALPIRTWNYKSDSPSVRHVGPMAQDFRAAFNLGKDDKHIDMVDASGVTMASVQALYQLMLEKDKQIERQGSQIATLTRTVEQQQAQLNQVRRAVRRRAAKR
jgi:hypothetical protein